MRIIAGTHRSRRFDAPEGRSTRPTLDKVREAVFSSLGGFFDGGNVLDLYAGSGAIGFEALSRGMDHAVFADYDRNAVRVIKANASSLGFEDRCTIYPMKAEKVIALLKEQDLRFDLVYLDPPYRRQENEKMLTKLCEAEILGKGAVVVLESLKEEQFSERIANLSRYKEAVYGISRISYYKIAEE